jgi:hypothetical protein
LRLGSESRSRGFPRAASARPWTLGFSGLYNLDFAGAQKDFAAWQQLHPDDPVGPIREAAAFLFSESNRLGVLEAQFYENDDAFAGRPKLTPDPALREHFMAAIGRAENLSHPRLAKDPKHRDAIFALTLSSGLPADYAALIEKPNLASLHYTKQASACGAGVARGLPRLLRRIAGDRLQQIHHREHGSSSALDSSHGWLARGQARWHYRFANNRRPWTLARALCSNPAVDCLGAGEKTTRAPCSGSPACAASFPPILSFPAKSRICRLRTSAGPIFFLPSTSLLSGSHHNSQLGPSHSPEIHPFVTVL